MAVGVELKGLATAHQTNCSRNLNARWGCGALAQDLVSSLLMLDELRERLHAEVEALNHELRFILPATLKKALEHGDLRENADYHAAIERQGMIQARLVRA